MESVAEQLTAACHARGLPVARDLDSRSSSRASRPNTADDLATDLPDQVLAYFDSGQGAKFFQVGQTSVLVRVPVEYMVHNQVDGWDV